MSPAPFETQEAPTSREEYIAILDMAIIMADSLIAQLNEVDAIMAQPDSIAA